MEECFIIMKLNSDEKTTIELIRNLSKQNTSDINNYFKGLMLCTLMNFSENEPTYIPYFGKLEIEYLGDKHTTNGRIADLNLKFTPSDVLVRNLGQLVDIKNPNCDMTITQVDCIKDIMKDITNKLNEIMDKNN